MKKINILNIALITLGLTQFVSCSKALKADRTEYRFADEAKALMEEDISKKLENILSVDSKNTIYSQVVEESPVFQSLKEEIIELETELSKNEELILEAQDKLSDFKSNIEEMDSEALEQISNLEEDKSSLEQESSEIKLEISKKKKNQIDFKDQLQDTADKNWLTNIETQVSETLNLGKKLKSKVVFEVNKKSGEDQIKEVKLLKAEDGEELETISAEDLLDSMARAIIVGKAQAAVSEK